MDAARRIAVVDLGTNSTRLLVADVTRRACSRSSSGGPRSPGSARASTPVRAAGARGHGAGGSAARRTTGSHRPPRAPSGRWPWPPAPCATPRTERVRGRSCASAAASTCGPSPATRRRGSPSWAPPPGGRRRARPTLVIDIGGGSTEYVVGRPGADPDFHVSTRMGSVRHTERHLHADPPRTGELDALAADVAPILAAESPGATCATRVERAIAVAGTADLARRHRPRARALRPRPGARLRAGTRLACERDPGQARRALPVERAPRGPRAPPRPRAHHRGRGGRSSLESLRAFGLTEVEVSEADILHGAALERGCPRVVRRTREPLNRRSRKGIGSPSAFPSTALPQSEIVLYSDSRWVESRAAQPVGLPLARYIGSGEAASYRRLPPSGPRGPFKARTPARPDGAVLEPPAMIAGGSVFSG